MHPELYLITNKLSNIQVSLLFNIRPQCIRGIKDNSHDQYNQNLKCDLCKKETDSQDHILKCDVLKQHIQWDHEKVKYEHIHETLQQQIKVTILLCALLELQFRLLEEGTVGWEPPCVLGGGLQYSNFTPNPPTKVHLGWTCWTRRLAYRGSELPHIQTLH